MAEAGERDSLPLEYAGPQGGRGRGRLMLWALVIAILGNIVVWLLWLPPLSSHYTSPRVKCQSNLRQIGQAILLYCNDQQGQYPDSFATILMNEDITAEVFVCPDSNDMPAMGATTQAVAANLLVPAHCSYIYIGSGLNSKTVTPETVVAYEPVANHGGAGMNVLFGDGHVEFVSAAAAGQIVAKVSAKMFPVTMPVN